MAIQHVVFVKFRKHASKADLDRFVEECNRLPAINREVKKWVAGFAPTPRFHSGDFDWGLSCELADWAAMDRYMWHEAHLRMGIFARAAVDYLLSFDFEDDYRAPETFMEPAALTAAPTTPQGKLRIPVVRGRQLDDARRLLSDAGLHAEEQVEEVLGAVWAPGRVSGSEPEQGSVVAPGSTVKLSVTGEWWSRPEIASRS